MRLSVRATAAAVALVWGGALFLVGVIHLINPDYGLLFLQMVASIYPGFDGAVGFGDLIFGTLFGLVDGAIGGALIAWLYNLFASGVTRHDG